ncbi:MAG: MFS transporter [Candidatus Competibacter sp.]
MHLHDTALELAALMLVFFSAFNLLEATLPSLIAKMAPPDAKGTAMGVYSSSQFLGAFAGGALGGWLRGLLGLKGVFALATFGALAWLLVAWTMANPRYLSSYLLNVGRPRRSGSQALGAAAGRGPGRGGSGGGRRRWRGLSQGGSPRLGRNRPAGVSGDRVLGDKSRPVYKSMA